MMDFRNLRIGQGYDAHQLVPGRELWLGGVLIHSEKGLLGHSDADVLIHSICDALLGAAGLGDIGLHFPSSDIKYKDIKSTELLKLVSKLIDEQNYAIINIDSTVLLEEPKIISFIPKMIKVISEILNLEESLISIKATTKEELDAVGKKEGAESFTVALLYKQS